MQLTYCARLPLSPPKILKVVTVVRMTTAFSAKTVKKPKKLKSCLSPCLSSGTSQIRSTQSPTATTSQRKSIPSIQDMGQKMAALLCKSGARTSSTSATTLDATSVPRVCRHTTLITISLHALRLFPTLLRRPFHSRYRWISSKIQRKRSNIGTTTGLRW